MYVHIKVKIWKPYGQGLGLGMGNWDGKWDWEWDMGMNAGEWEIGMEIESTPVPEDDSIISQATT